MKSEDDNKKREEEMKRSNGPFVPVFMSRGVAVGERQNGSASTEAARTWWR